MKKITPIDAHSNDEDIAQLFASQRVSVPAELRTSIFEQANFHCAEDLNSQDENTRVATYSNNRWTRGFAIAATLSMVAIIAPMLLKEPESSLDSLNTDLSTMTTTAHPAQTSVPIQYEQTPEILSTPAESLAEEINDMADNSIAASKSADIGASAAASDTMKRFNAESTTVPQARTSKSALTLQREFDSVPSLSYRESPDKWINEIKVLVANGDEQKAREEYRLFEQQHPKQAISFKPDFTRSPMVDQMPADDGNSQ